MSRKMLFLATFFPGRKKTFFRWGIFKVRRFRRVHLHGSQIQMHFQFLHYVNLHRPISYSERQAFMYFAQNNGLWIFIIFWRIIDNISFFNDCVDLPNLSVPDLSFKIKRCHEESLCFNSKIFLKGNAKVLTN